MNFLAHCLIPELAQPGIPDGVVVGGFLGDFLKGSVPATLPAALADGVRLHRRLDAFSNQHETIRLSCARLPTPLRRIAPVFVDLVADHLLARNWAAIYHQPLTGYTAQTYTRLERLGSYLPESARQFLEHAIRHDLFAAYADMETLNAAIRSVARRLGRPEAAELVQTAVADALPQLDADFRDYFPELVAHADAWLVDRGYGPVPKADSLSPTHSG
ncbi:MAG: ACP phosphodiesterase [Pseudomonadales bacterium]